MEAAATTAETKKIRIRVLTPLKVVFDSFADMAVTRSTEGNIGFLHGHEPCSAVLDIGILRIFNDGDEAGVFMVLGGIVTMLDNEVTVISPMAEHPDKMQAAIDKLNEDRAASRIIEQAAELSMHRSETAIRRALVHMDVNVHSILKDDGKHQ